MQSRGLLPILSPAGGRDAPKGAVRVKQLFSFVRAFVMRFSPLTVAFATSLPSGARRPGGSAERSSAILPSRGEIDGCAARNHETDRMTKPRKADIVGFAVAMMLLLRFRI
ncbi:hypothetical protein TM49_05575 [Martelella endophytica]|uniref:Uncharacterized protein n=1 Tax=Martelella endophytica TaxID=1486262 RepID=A0A0D5LND0_MAREN|nr:hypothetical protein TM49_05575 [Martelella endophytica]